MSIQTSGREYDSKRTSFGSAPSGKP